MKNNAGKCIISLDNKQLSATPASHFFPGPSFQMAFFKNQDYLPFEYTILPFLSSTFIFTATGLVPSYIYRVSILGYA